MRILFILLAFGTTSWAQTDSTSVRIDSTVFDFPEVLPKFPGGEKAMYQWLSRQVNYPAMAREAGVQGTVYLRFIVEKDGELSDVRVIKGVGAGWR